MKKINKILKQRAGMTILNVLVAFVVVIISIGVFYGSIKMSDKITIASEKLRTGMENGTNNYLMKTNIPSNPKDITIEFTNELSSVLRFRIYAKLQYTDSAYGNSYFFLTKK
ncbi:MAG: hypothetical protein RRY79_00050 [Clostridia bacterium]